MTKSIIPFLLLCLQSLNPAAQILLRYDLEAGKNYPTIFEVNQTIDQTIMGVDQHVDSKQTMEMDMVVGEVGGGLTEMDISYTRITVMQSSPTGELYYDSDDAGSNTADATLAYSVLVGNGFRVSFDHQGHIQKVSGLELMIDRIIESMNITDPVEHRETKHVVKEQFDEDALSSQIQNSLAIFPDTNVSIGDTWKVDQSITSPFPMRVISSYLLTDYDDDFAYLSVKSEMDSDETSPMENAGITMNISISGEQSGTIKVDRKTGMMVESFLKQMASGTIEMISPEAMTWPIKLETEVIVTGKF